ncbi:hypothetical protein NDU88_003070 [Pleurodeles waltl]|uniref:Uncharacterized protein n=1 Tax=Pleurodeles waltl TaxID=8319 RepID=A0AAV7T461_PLEWA|nr:hypothetical protein NDU88_003070 [Pleurodeles waltl]
MLLPTNEDMDDDLVSDGCENMEVCSLRLIKMLIKHAKRKMEQQSVKSEVILKELKKSKDNTMVKELLLKMEKTLQEYDNEIMERKARKCTRDSLDYQYGHIYMFAKKFDHLRANEKLDKPKNSTPSQSNLALTHVPAHMNLL